MQLNRDVSECLPRQEFVPLFSRAILRVSSYMKKDQNHLKPA